MPDFAFKVRLSDVSAKQISPNIARSPSAVPFYRLDFNGKVIQSDVSTQPGDPQWKHQSNFEYRLSEPSVDALFHSLASRFAVLHVLFLEPDNGSGRKEILAGSCSVDLFTLACGAARCAYDLRLDTSSLSQNNGVNSSNMNAPFMSSQPITSGAITGKAEFTLVMDQQTTVSISLQTVTVTPMPYGSPYKLAYSLASSAGSHEVESNVVSATTDPTWDAQLLPRIISRTTLKDLLKDTLKVTIKDVGQKGAPAVGKFEIVFSDLITSHTDHTVPFRRNAYAIAGAPSLSGGGGQQQQKEISRYVSSSSGGDGLVKSFQGDSTNISGGVASLQGFSSSWGALVTGSISFKDLPHLSQLSPENSTNINGTVHGRPLLKSCVVPSSLSKYPAPSATSMMLANTSRETNRTFVKNGGVPTSATQFHNDLYGGQPTVPLSSAGHGSVSIGGQTVPIGVNLSNMTLGNHTTGNPMPPSITAADTTMGGGHNNNYPNPYSNSNNEYSSGDLASVSAVRANLSTAPSSGQVGYFPTSPRKVPEVGGAVGGTRVPAFSTDGAASPMTADGIRAQLQQLEERKAKFNIAPPPPPISQLQQQQLYHGNGGSRQNNMPPQQAYPQQSQHPNQHQTQQQQQQQHRQDTTTMSAWNSPRTAAAAPSSSVTVTHHHHYGGGRGGAVAAAANAAPRTTTMNSANDASTFTSQRSQRPQQSYASNPIPRDQHLQHPSAHQEIDDDGWTNPYREGDNSVATGAEAYSQMIDPLYRVRSRRGSVAMRGGGGAGAPNANTTGLPTSNNISSANHKYESRFDSPNRTTRQGGGEGEMRNGFQQQHPPLYVSSASAAEVSTLPRHVSPPRGGMADNAGVPNRSAAMGDSQAVAHRRKITVGSPLFSETLARNGSSSRPTSPLMSTSGRIGQQSSMMMTASATMPILNNPITATGQALVDQYKEAVANIETQMARVATMESQLADQTLKEESMLEDALKALEKEEASISYDIKKCERVIAEIKRAQEEYITDEHKTRLETEMRENGILNELDDVARVENELIALMDKVHINIREDEIAKERAKEERERARKRLDVTSREFNDLSHKARATDSRSRSVSAGRRQMSEEVVAQYRTTPLRSLSSPNRRGGRVDDRLDVMAKPTSTYKSLSPLRRESQNETRRALDFSIRHHHEQSLGSSSSAHNNSNNPAYVNSSHLHRDPFSSTSNDAPSAAPFSNYDHRQQRVPNTTSTISPKRERGAGSFMPTDSRRMEVGAPTLLPPLRVVESKAVSPHSEREQRRREAQQKQLREEEKEHGSRDQDWKSRTATLSPLRSRGNYETSGEGSHFGKSSSNNLPVAPSLHSIGISSIPTNVSNGKTDNTSSSRVSASFSNVNANGGAGTDNMSVTLQLDMRDMAKAIETSNVPMFRAVLSQNPDVLYATNSWLHAACAVDKPSYEIISAIVTMRPELAHAADSITGNLPLHFLCAAREPSVKAVDCLLAAGGGSGAVAYSGPVTIHNKDGLTPFQVALLNVYDVPSSSSTSSSSPTSPHSSRSLASSVKELLLKRCGKEVLFSKTNKGESCAHLCAIHDKYLPNLKFLFKSGAPCSDTAIVLGAANAGLAVTPLEKSRMYGEAATEIQRYLQHVVGQ